MYIDKIFHLTQDGRYLSIANISDEEFEIFIDKYGFEPESKNNKWPNQEREILVKAMVNMLNQFNEKIIENINMPNKDKTDDNESLTENKSTEKDEEQKSPNININ